MGYSKEFQHLEKAICSTVPYLFLLRDKPRIDSLELAFDCVVLIQNQATSAPLIQNKLVAGLRLRFHHIPRFLPLMPEALGHGINTVKFGADSIIYARLSMMSAHTS